jgi:hypothetical protein
MDAAAVQNLVQQVAKQAVNAALAAAAQQQQQHQPPPQPAFAIAPGGTGC